MATLNLLRWSKHSPTSDIEDPLGLNLRGVARLGESLLNGITSVTRRARYYSFLPWCISHHQHKDRSHALALREAIVLREKALALGCIILHKDDPKGTCKGGNVVGTIKAKHWLRKKQPVADLDILTLGESPALDIYYGSLVNLGCFNDEMPVSDPDHEVPVTFDDIELSPLGTQLAKAYDAQVSSLSLVRQVAAGRHRCSVKALREFARHGGLCELSTTGAADSTLLRNVFFNIVDLQGKSHDFRRQSLLLILDLCHQFSADEWVFNEPDFAGAVYFGELVVDDERLEIRVPSPLVDIATRWRMFYFHNFMGVALEGLFCWIVAQLRSCGLAGASLEGLVLRLKETAVRKELSELLNCKMKTPFSETTPHDFFATLRLPHGNLDTALGKRFDAAVRSTHAVAEDSLEPLIREHHFIQSSTGLALPMILLATTLMRYARWEGTNYGNWLAGFADPRNAYDPYLDLVPPLLANGLYRTFGQWWNCKWSDLTAFVLSRYVVRQHCLVSDERRTGNRCLLHETGSKVFATGEYEKIGMGNPRLRSAIQILKDLGLMEDWSSKVTYLTKEGKRFVKHEMKKEVVHDVS